MCRDLIARMSEVYVEGVTGKFGVPGMNDSGEFLFSMCIEKGIVVGNTFFKRRKAHKHTWVSGVDETDTLLGCMLVERDMKERLGDVNVLMGIADGMSDLCSVEANFIIIGRVDGRNRA